MKLCFIDTETTGTDPRRHGLIQVAGIICTKDHEQEFMFRMKPFKGDLLNSDALTVNRIKVEKLTELEEPAKIYGVLANLFSTYVDKYNKADKMFFIGYNAQFDYDFMRVFWEKNDDKYFGSFFWYPSLDVMRIAAFKLMGDRPKMANFKLETVAKHFGIDYNSQEAHDALYDVKITRALWEIVIKL